MALSIVTLNNVTLNNVTLNNVMLNLIQHLIKQGLRVAARNDAKSPQ